MLKYLICGEGKKDQVPHRIQVREKNLITRLESIRKIDKFEVHNKDDWYKPTEKYSA